MNNSKILLRVKDAVSRLEKEYPESEFLKELKTYSSDDWLVEAVNDNGSSKFFICEDSINNRKLLFKLYLM